MAWFKFINNGIYPKVAKNDNHEHYDWWGGEYDAFFHNYREFQSYIWHVDCSENKNCKNHRVETSQGFRIGF